MDSIFHKYHIIVALNRSKMTFCDFGVDKTMLSVSFDVRCNCIAFVGV